MRIAWNRARWIAVALLITLLVPSMPAHSRAATLFTVSTTNDSGANSLRDAIINAKPGATIAFAIPGVGVQTITLAAALPNIAADVVIDATT